MIQSLILVSSFDFKKNLQYNAEWQVLKKSSHTYLNDKNKCSSSQEEKEELPVEGSLPLGASAVKFSWYNKLQFQEPCLGVNLASHTKLLLILSLVRTEALSDWVMISKDRNIDNHQLI